MCEEVRTVSPLEMEVTGGNLSPDRSLRQCANSIPAHETGTQTRTRQRATMQTHHDGTTYMYTHRQRQRQIQTETETEVLGELQSGSARLAKLGRSSAGTRAVDAASKGT